MERSMSADQSRASSMHFVLYGMWATRASYLAVYASPDAMCPCGAERYRPRGNEGSIRFCECNRVVAVPGIEDSLLCVAWNGPGLVEGGLAVVRFPGGVLVELLEIDRSPERPVLLGADHHVVAPSVRVPGGPAPARHLCPTLPSIHPASGWECLVGVWQGLGTAVGSMLRGAVIIGSG